MHLEFFKNTLPQIIKINLGIIIVTTFLRQFIPNKKTEKNQEVQITTKPTNKTIPADPKYQGSRKPIKPQNQEINNPLIPRIKKIKSPSNPTNKKRKKTYAWAKALRKWKS